MLHTGDLQRLRERWDGHADHAGGGDHPSVSLLRRLGHRGVLLRDRHRAVGAAPGPTMSDLDAGDDPAEPEPGPVVAEPAATEVLRTPLEALELSPEDWRIVAVAAVEMDLPSANPEVVLHEAQD